MQQLKEDILSSRSMINTLLGGIEDSVDEINKQEQILKEAEQFAKIEKQFLMIEELFNSADGKFIIDHVNEQDKIQCFDCYNSIQTMMKRFIYYVRMIKLNPEEEKKKLFNLMNIRRILQKEVKQQTSINSDCQYRMIMEIRRLEKEINNAKRFLAEVEKVDNNQTTTSIHELEVENADNGQTTTTIHELESKE